MKHTPEPWDCLSTGDNNYVYKNEGQVLDFIYKRIADVTSAKDAKLITTAPILLLAAELVFDAFNLDDLSNFTQEQKHAILSLHKAIQKATMD